MSLGKQVALLILSTLAVIAFVGCATPGGAALKRCELGLLPATAQGALAVGQAIAADPSSTTADLEAAALQFLPGQFECAMQALAAWWMGKTAPADGNALMAASSTAQQWHAQALLKAYLTAHPATACGGRVAL